MPRVGLATLGPFGLVLGMIFRLAMPEADRGCCGVGGFWFLAALMVLAMVRVPSGSRYKCLLGVLFCFGFGWGWMSWTCHRRLARLPAPYHLDRAVEVEGRVRHHWQTRYGQAILLERVRFLHADWEDVELRRLTIFTPALPAAPRRRSPLRAWIRLKRKVPPRTIPWPLQRLRERYAPRFSGNVKTVRLMSWHPQPDAPDSALSPANRELWRLFTANVPAQSWRKRLEPLGLGHLLAISGLHCMLVFAVLRWLSFPLRRPWWRSGFTVVGLLVFGSWMGWSDSVTRAVSMLAGFQVMCWLGRVRDWYRLWTFLLCLALVLDPFSLLRAGFWYSFAASLGLVLGRGVAMPASPLDHPWLPRLKRFLPILGAQLMVLPVGLVFGCEINPLSVIWNLVGFFLLCFLLVLGALAGLSLVWTDLVPWCNSLESALVWLLALPEPVIEALRLVRFPFEPAWALAFLFVSFLILRYGFREWRWYGAMLFCLLFCSIHHRPLSGERLVMFDVGQGLAMMLTDAQGRTLLFDCGGQLPLGLRPESLVRLFGGKDVAGAFVSHHNADHYNLLPRFVRPFPIWVPRGQWGRFHFEQDLSAFIKIPVEAGAGLAWGRFRLEVIWPRGSPEPTDTNEGSLVIRIARPGAKVLLMGDAGTWTERYLDRDLFDSPRGGGAATTVSLLQVGHHGSRSGTGRAFLERLKPDVALISCGAGNRFGHPHPQVLSNLRQQRVPWLTTADSGTLILLGGRPKGHFRFPETGTEPWSER
ncbi:ComEC/Rec2 family competence protein [Sulfidibacter corallicola]|uniref:ComEC/Rec2 family competence protein n=1 Tax=Sulfidibacter corallicola TaxID=2818388 RepID=A0A8A4TT06_SULCO|nr:ComEC/Rec2 family competence protein [Sulfidibacter corallicola]QTD53089.1 ComEC/Rec2 family competence protein [Sulfidibacter corallicola]